MVKWKVQKREGGGTSSKGCDVLWTDNNSGLKEMEKMIENPRLMCPIQRVSHFPNNKQLHRKDCLANTMSPLRRALPEEFNFSPVTFNNSAAETETLQEFVQNRPPRPDGKAWTYIVKPAGGLQGAGIYLTQDPIADVPPESAGKHVVTVNTTESDIDLCPPHAPQRQNP